MWPFSLFRRKKKPYSGGLFTPIQFKGEAVPRRIRGPNWAPSPASFDPTPIFDGGSVDCGGSDSGGCDGGGSCGD